MGLTLYQLEQEFIEIQRSLEESDGELTEEIEEAMKINESDLESKAVGYAMVIKQIDGEVEIIKKELDRLSALKKQREAAADRLRFTVSEAMKLYGKNEIKTATIRLSFRPSVVVNVTDEKLIPMTYMVTHPETYSPDKKLIKQYLDAKVKIPGAELKENKNLQIK